MKEFREPGAVSHPAAAMYAGEVARGELSRREFLVRTTALGMSAAAAYGLIGLPMPAMAQETPKDGGTLRMSMELKALKDPRTADWSQIANFTRGWLEYLAEYNNDGSVRGMLVESWEANADAKPWFKSLSENLKVAKSLPQIPEWGQVDGAISAQLTQAFAGQIKAKDALEAAQAGVDEVMKDAGYY